MIVTRGKLTVAQAARPAIAAECIECGSKVVVLAEHPHASLDHRCGTLVVGPVWTLLERPADTAAARAAVLTDLEQGGVLTAEQARAQLAAVVAADATRAAA